MGIEIERKFLVTGEGWRAAAHAVIDMAQGYLNDFGALDAGGQKASVRVRIEGEQAFLNIKSVQLGHTRQEFEYPVPVADAHALLQLCVASQVVKRRHLVRHAGLVWEVDEFAGDNAGLVVAEVELEHAEQVIEHPHWVGAEVTDAPRYYNVALASRPYCQWSADERG